MNDISKDRTFCQIYPGKIPAAPSALSTTRTKTLFAADNQKRYLERRPLSHYPLQTYIIQPKGTFSAMASEEGKGRMRRRAELDSSSREF